MKVFSGVQNRRLVPPMRREHQRKQMKGTVLEMLANECMEQLYDDSPDGKFGHIGLLSFTRLHHLSLHYFEVELSTELEIIVNTKNTDEAQIFKIRKMLHEYSKCLPKFKFLLSQILNCSPPSRRSYQGLRSCPAQELATERGYLVLVPRYYSAKAKGNYQREGRPLLG